MGHESSEEKCPTDDHQDDPEVPDEVVRATLACGLLIDRLADHAEAAIANIVIGTLEKEPDHTEAERDTPRDDEPSTASHEPNVAGCTRGRGVLLFLYVSARSRSRS